MMVWNMQIDILQTKKYAPPFYLSVARLLLAKRWTFLDGCTPTVGKEKDILDGCTPTVGKEMDIRV